MLLAVTTKRPMAKLAEDPALIARYRRKLADGELLFGRLPRGARRVAVDDREAGVLGEWIVPRSVGASGPVVLYLHGGGYVAGSPGMYRTLTGRLCVDCDARVFALDYRLAPEHHFPAAVEDAVVAYRWLLDQRIDARRIVLAGDSAGGGLTVSTLLALRAADVPLPAGAVLICPWVDLATTGDSIVTNAATDDVVVAYPGESRLARAYVGPNGALDDPAASGLYADLTGLPPLLIQASTIEVLRDDATRFHEKARSQGVDSTLRVFDGVPHVWHLFTWLAESRAAFFDITAFVARVTNPTN